MMWNKPWSLREGCVIGGGLIVVGALLQFSVGPINWDVFAWPVNMIVLLLYLILLFVGYVLRDKVYALRFLMTWKMAVPALTYAVLLTVVMGITQQVPSDMSPIDPVGFSKMLSFWPFVLVYVLLATIIGLVSIRQVCHFSFRNIPSLLSHLGLFLVLTCGTLGSADMQRLKMFCEYDQPEWRALDEANQVHDLNVAIQLNRFIMEQDKKDKMPKRFASDVDIMTEDGKHIKTIIEVNKPYSINGWKIYQYGYDQAMGPMSRYSVFEWVRDPWLPFVYIGVGLLGLGAIGMFVMPVRKKEGIV